MELSGCVKISIFDWPWHKRSCGTSGLSAVASTPSPMLASSGLDLQMLRSYRFMFISFSLITESTIFGFSMLVVFKHIFLRLDSPSYDSKDNLHTLI